MILKLKDVLKSIFGTVQESKFHEDILWQEIFLSQSDGMYTKLFPTSDGTGKFLKLIFNLWSSN